MEEGGGGGHKVRSHCSDKGDTLKHLYPSRFFGKNSLHNQLEEEERNGNRMEWLQLFT